MPNVSQAQRGAMAEAAEGKSKLGIPKKVGEEYMAADQGGSLPEYANDRADNLKKRGLISDEQHKKLKAKSKAASKPKPKNDDDADDRPATLNAAEDDED